MRIEDIDISKIKWTFWQSSFMYDYGNGFVCLFHTDVKPVDRHGNPCIPLHGTKHNYVEYGTFSLYKTFKLSTGEFGIDKGHPLKMIDLSIEMETPILNDFRQMGIYECYNQYEKPNMHESNN